MENIPANPADLSIPILKLPNTSPAPACDSPPRINIRHPGYKEFTSDNILFDFPAFDNVELSKGQRIQGLHHKTALTACAIIANNSFDDVYLSKDPDGEQRVQADYDGILEPGDYWLQLPSYHPPATSEPTPTAPTQSKYHYPIVPTFEDWAFPHNRLPAEWQQSQLVMANQTENRCRLSNSRLGLQHCHIVPTASSRWFSMNGMKVYSEQRGDPRIDDEANRLWLMANLYHVFEQRCFVLVPKPLPNSSSSGAQFAANSSQSDTSLTSTANPAPTVRARAYTFAVHVLDSGPEALELAEAYHNSMIHAGGACREMLFARFAWAIFGYLGEFINNTEHELHLRIKRTQAKTENVWLTPKGWRDLKSSRENSPTGSRKRQRGRSRHRSIPPEFDDYGNGNGDSSIAIPDAIPLSAPSTP
ncbi:hypothetical protein O1611_g1655 [Lasiodiplodia mahajangana]|uniref:Uncharacterized protein n=1 Tax=Lasiodiplodia mahajangana TaxID=1108764 RepID=A0ACC2JXB0_9PEZI|nr:hypothetical protein O1611_g1655 [Lasiodiplodia mahajangana]